MQKAQIKQVSILGGARFDYLKFVLAILIMVMHSGAVPRSLLPITRLCVPLFFIMTSYFFHGKLKEYADPEERRNRLFRFVKREVSLYTFWSIILTPIVFYYNIEWFRYGVIHAVTSILKSILVTGYFPASWFIVASVYAMIIVFILSKRLNNGWLFFIAMFLYSIALLDSNYGGLLSPDVRVKLSCLGIPWSRNIPAAMIWIVIGKILAEKNLPSKISTRFIFLLIVCSFALYYSEFLLIEHNGWSIHTDCYLTSLILCTFIFVAIMKGNDVKCNNALWFRKSSIIIYCFHRTFIVLLTAISCRFFPLPKIWIFFVTLIVSLCVAAIVIWLYEKRGVKILKYSF